MREKSLVKLTPGCKQYTLGPEQNFTGPTLLTKSSAKTVIIAGTISKSSLIDSLISSGKLDVSPIAGSDLRGTVYGLYDVSEGMGVSPWYWWADVPVKRKSGVWAKEGRKVQKAPSVKYRGIFINDEQPGLTNWAK